MSHVPPAGFRKLGDHSFNQRRSRADQNGPSIKISHPRSSYPCLFFSPQSCHVLNLSDSDRLDIYQNEDYIYIVRSDDGNYKISPYNKNSPCGPAYKLHSRDFRNLREGLYLYLGKERLPAHLYPEAPVADVFGFHQPIESKPRSRRSKPASISPGF